MLLMVIKIQGDFPVLSSVGRLVKTPGIFTLLITVENAKITPYLIRENTEDQ